MLVYPTLRGGQYLTVGQREKWNAPKASCSELSIVMALQGSFTLSDTKLPTSGNIAWMVTHFFANSSRQKGMMWAKTVRPLGFLES